MNYQTDSDVEDDDDESSVMSADASATSSGLESPSASIGNVGEEHHVPHPGHVLDKRVTGSTGHHGPQACLLWACKACKKKTITVDRRKAATLRERRRLRKVFFLPYSSLLVFDIFLLFLINLLLALISSQSRTSPVIKWTKPFMLLS
jgi:hypothetical protein